MATITTTVQVTKDNTREVTNKKGELVKVVNALILKGNKEAGIKGIYGSAFLPPYVENGDVVTISGATEATKSGEYINYNFKFPTVDKAFIEKGSLGASSTNTVVSDDFGGSPMDISEDDLPF